VRVLYRGWGRRREKRRCIEEKQWKVTEWRNRSTEGRDKGRDRGKRQQKKRQERDRGEERNGRDRGGEIRCVRHKVYRRINAGSETVVMRYRRRDKGGETEGRNREDREERQREIQRKKTEGVTEGRDRRRKEKKETKGKRQRGKIEGEKPDVRDIGHNDTEW
jgi:hypothetical protein